MPSNCCYVYTDVVHGEAEDHHSGVMTLPLIAEVTSYGYADYKSRLRTTMMALATTGLSCGQADL